MYLDQQVRQVAQGLAEGVVDPLSAGVCGDLGRQTSKQPAEGLGPVAVQREEVLELADHSLDDLALARCPPAIGLRPCPPRVVLRCSRDQRPILLQPATLPLHPRKTFVRQVGFVTVRGYEGFPYGPLVGGRLGQTEDGDHPVGIYHESYLEAVDPFGLGSASSEGGLPAEEALAGYPHPHDRREEGGIQDAVDGRRLAEFPGQRPLQRAQLGLQGSDAPVELALRTKVREVASQMRPSEAPEVPLASEAGPLGEDGQGEDFRIAEQGRTTAFGRPRSVLELPPVVYEDVQ